MRYTVTYRHLPRSLFLEERLSNALGRFPGEARTAHVVFSREGRAAAVSCHLTGPRLDLFIRERGADLYTVLDDVGRKLSRLGKSFRKRRQTPFAESPFVESGD
jgi:ribosome-associated translation inhibitor RaiA